jgi:GntR family transcriptional regulator
MSPFLLECAKQGKTGRFEVLRIERIQPSDDVAARLDIPAGPGCLRYRVTAPA